MAKDLAPVGESAYAVGSFDRTALVSEISGSHSTVAVPELGCVVLSGESTLPSPCTINPRPSSE